MDSTRTGASIVGHVWPTWCLCFEPRTLLFQVFDSPALPKELISAPLICVSPVSSVGRERMLCLSLALEPAGSHYLDALLDLSPAFFILAVKLGL